MNADLEEQLKEMGPDYQSVVARLRSARTVEPGHKGLSFARSTAAWLIAASILGVVGLTILCLDSQPSTFSFQPSASPAYGAREYHLSPEEMIAAQKPDGGWQNDFLTRRNAEILAKCEGKVARIAYKKALRHLRAKGIRH